MVPLVQSITYNLIKQLLFVYTRLNNQTVRFLSIQFSISHKFSLTYREDPIRCYHSESEWTWQQWQWKVLYIPKIFQAGASPSDCIMSFPGPSLWVGVLPHHRDAVSVFNCPGDRAENLLESQKDWSTKFLVAIKYREVIQRSNELDKCLVLWAPLGV